MLSYHRSCIPIVLATLLCTATAFSSIQTVRPLSASKRQSLLLLRSIGDDSNGDINKDNPLKGMELTSALARIDEQWQIQQRRAPGQSRWTKLVLPPEEEEQDDDNDNDTTVMEDPSFQQQAASTDDIVYLLEPSNSFSPSCVIVFVGGAGLGQFPQIAYNEFLKRLSDKLNAAILTVPYTVGLDHFELAKQTGDRLRRAILYCQDDPKRQYPESLPVFALSHSLGSKLQTIYVAATMQSYRGMGFISYNNFGFGQTLQMARTFAEQLRGNYYSGKDSFEMDDSVKQKSNEAFDMIFGMAETVLNAVGLDFSPSAKDTERLVQLKFDEELQEKTRLFVLDDDDLDSSVQFALNCNANGGPGPSTSGVAGTHLTPVYIKLGLDDLPQDIPREFAEEFAGGYESASFGDESNMDELVQEVANWILGREPSRPAYWQEEAGRPDRLIAPTLQGGESDSR